jgi:hypothetical protein
MESSGGAAMMEPRELNIKRRRLRGMVVSQWRRGGIRATMPRQNNHTAESGGSARRERAFDWRVL